MDGTVVAIARLGCSVKQKAAYDGHKRKHAHKFQTVTAPGGLLFHVDGLIENRRHDLALYVCR